MRDVEAERKQQAGVLLALGVSRQQPLFPAPSDEELAMLIEGRLDATRKAQLMNVIANDPATFARWTNAVETAQTLGLGQFATAVEAQTAAAPQSTLGRWLKALRQNPLPSLTAGGGLVAAAVIAVMVVMPGGYDSQVDSLYNDYGRDWQALPAEAMRTRDIIGIHQPELSAPDWALKAGVLSGLDRLGERFALHNLAASPDDNPIDEQQIGLPKDYYRVLYASGKLAALGHFKCALGAEPGYFTEAAAVLQSLQPELSRYQDDTSVSLSRTLQRDGNAETQVCRFSKAVLKRVEDAG